MIYLFIINDNITIIHGNIQNILHLDTQASDTHQTRDHQSHWPQAKVRAHARQQEDLPDQAKSRKRKWRMKYKRREINKEKKHVKDTESCFGGCKHAQVHIPL